MAVSIIYIKIIIQKVVVARITTLTQVISILRIKFVSSICTDHNMKIRTCTRSDKSMNTSFSIYIAINTDLNILVDSGF